MALDVSRPITRREFPITYISPLVCEEIMSASGEVEINILPFDELLFPGGFLVTGIGQFVLSWNAVPRALCYNIYRSLGPDGPFQLISSCQTDREYSDDPGPGSWYYRVTAVTPEGETPPTPPTTSTDEEPPVDPGECPPEIGDDTIPDLIIPEDTSLGSVTPNPDTAVDIVEDFGSFPAARYSITYTGGAWKSDSNPFPGDWKFIAYTWLWDSGVSSFDPCDPLIAEASQAAVEAAVPVGKTLEFFHYDDPGTISVGFSSAGSPSNFEAGSPNPTFELKRTGTFIPQPDQIRIKDYTPTMFSLGTCSTRPDLVNPEWDGTLPFRSLFYPGFAQWTTAVQVSWQGKEVFVTQVDYFASHPTNGTGVGWVWEFTFFDGVALVLGWRGIKGIGNTPVGRYYRTGGCLEGPDCLEFEEY